MQRQPTSDNNNNTHQHTAQHEPAASEHQDKQFSDFGLHPSLLTAISQSGYTTPTPIQAQAIPAVLAGQDVMGAAQTGTGKTAAFTLPVLHRILPFASHSTSPARHPVRALILTPTRELADQVADSVQRYCATTPLRSAVVYGGVDIRPQRDQLRQGCELLIATPGRLLDHLEQRHVNLSQVTVLVLDEADRMLDMGFMPDLERIVSHLPKVRQNLLFSATFSPEIRKLARRVLRNPVEITVANTNQTADTVTQIVYEMPAEDKRAALLYLLMTQYQEQVIVFANTRLEVNRLTRFLSQEGISAEAIHGDRSQLERSRTLDAFKAGEVKVLVATDVAARGLDVAGLPCVINYDIPFHAEDYVHRIGRTGRAGAKGTAIALYDESVAAHLEAIEALIATTLPRQSLDLPDAFRTRGSGRGSASTGRSRYDRGVQRSGSGSGTSAYGSHGSSSRGRAPSRGALSAAAAQAPLDPFFYTPYESSEATTPARVNLKQVLATHQQQVEDRQEEPVLAVLLGGTGRR